MLKRIKTVFNTVSEVVQVFLYFYAFFAIVVWFLYLCRNSLSVALNYYFVIFENIVNKFYTASEVDWTLIIISALCIIISYILSKMTENINMLIDNINSLLIDVNNKKEIKEEIHKNDNSGTKAENKEIPDTHTTLQKLRKMFNQEMISEEMHIRLDETEAEFEKEAKKLNNILDFNHKFKGEISDDILQKQISTLKSITDEKEFNEKLSEFERDNNRLILQMQKVNEWLNF